MPEWLEDLHARFILNFIDDDRWRYMWNGLGVTLTLTFGALVIGVILGLIIAFIRTTHDKNIASMRLGPGKILLRMGNAFCKLYLTVIRGTPIVVQLLIAFFIIFISSRNKIFVGVLTFGVNSGAYVAEIFRSGIMSIDNGQIEAGRSLGFGYLRTMRYIVTPQAFKNVLPTLCNEFIVLLKETSVAGYIALEDLAKGADIIRGRTFDAFMPIIACALIYLVLVIFFTWLVGKLERRLRNSDH